MLLSEKAMKRQQGHTKQSGEAQTANST